MFQTKVAEKIKTHILCTVTFLDNRVINEITWKNIVQPGRPQVTIWCMHNTYLILKVINTHSEYPIVIAFLL